MCLRRFANGFSVRYRSVGMFDIRRRTVGGRMRGWTKSPRSQAHYMADPLAHPRRNCHRHRHHSRLLSARRSRVEEWFRKIFFLWILFLRFIRVTTARRPRNRNDEHAGKTTTTMMTTRNKIIQVTSTEAFPCDGSNDCIGGNRSAGTRDCCTTGPYWCPTCRADWDAMHGSRSVGFDGGPPGNGS